MKHGAVVTVQASMLFSAHTVSFIKHFGSISDCIYDKVANELLSFASFQHIQEHKTPFLSIDITNS